MKEALAALGVAPERIHVEIFNGSESMTPGVVGAVTRAAASARSTMPAPGALVSFARSGIAAHWDASAYQSLLELAEACDVPVRWSCRTGVCHNCESGLVFGRGRLRTGAARPARRRQPSRVLLATDSRRRHRLVTPRVEVFVSIRKSHLDILGDCAWPRAWNAYPSISRVNPVEALRAE